MLLLNLIKKDNVIYTCFKEDIMPKKIVFSCLFIIVITLQLTAFESTSFSPSIYNVQWDSPSTDRSAQMPIGNGNLAAGVYVLENGDLYLLLSKNDALNYCGDLFKTGRVKISLNPNPFKKNRKFSQKLNLKTGSIEIKTENIDILIWVDAYKPIYHIEINAPKNIEVTVNPEFWERIDHCAFNCMEDSTVAPPQDVREDRDGAIIWYYNVGNQSTFSDDMNYYGVSNLIKTTKDPLKYNIFGNLIDSNQLDLKNGLLKGTNNKFDIRIYSLTQKEKKSENWITAIQSLSKKRVDLALDWINHTKYWENFWNRSWIRVSDNTVPKKKREKFIGESSGITRREIDSGALVSQSYNVFRFLMACQAKGSVPVKFNGGLFTMPLKYDKETKSRFISEDGKWRMHEDERDWGRRFTFQNQRLLYWPLLMSGDYELIQPFFNYYNDLLPIRKAITQSWFGHKGAYFRENTEPTGGERDNGRDGKPPRVKPGENKGNGYYHSFYFTSGLETVAMMIDYYEFSEDKSFKDEVLVPFAKEVLLFFDKHYKRDNKGKLKLDPAMVLETWWIAINPSPDLAGLKYNLDKLILLDIGGDANLKEWKRLQSEIPKIKIKGIGKNRWIAPAYKYKKNMNAENGLLYPVFPFRLYGKAFGNEQIVINTMKHRGSVDAFDHKCWSQDQIDWALAGDAKEAQDGLIHRFRHSSKYCRFPLYGSAGPDSCPDFDHFGSGSIALQRMLIQEDNGKILLLPAWPSNWDVDFKLHLKGNTTISATVCDGKLEKWTIEPKSREKDVIICNIQ